MAVGIDKNAIYNSRNFIKSLNIVHIMKSEVIYNSRNFIKSLNLI